MKTYKNSILFLLIMLALTTYGCSYIDTEFGFEGSINGKIQDGNGNALYGDINSNSLIVRLLGENDKETIDIRVNGDGTFQNVRMYPKLHKAWVEGPIVFSDTVLIDFGENLDQVHDFTITPLISPEIVNGTASGTSIAVEYSIVPTDANTVSKKEIYCSTVKYPTASIGSMTNIYTTKTVTLAALSGNTQITGLVAGTTYYLRIGAQASASKIMNYSNQVVIKVP